MTKMAMLYVEGIMGRTDNTIVSGAVELLADRLPPGWTVRAGVSDDRHLEVSAASGECGRIAMRVAKRLDPRGVRELEGTEGVVLTPYASPAVRAALEARGLGYADLTGNARVVLTEPGLFIRTDGAASNPWPEKRTLSLRGTKAGRVVEALVSTPLPVGVRALAGLAGTDPGYVSRLLAKLDREALIDREGRGEVAWVDWQRLLARWAEDSPLASRSERSTWIAPRGLSSVRARLVDLALPYALTGSEVASGSAPIAPTRLLSIYVEHRTAVAEALGLVEADAGVNVVLLEPEDPAVLEGRVADGGVFRSTLPRVVADLLSGPGRSPAEGEALMAWMSENPDVWRG